MPSALIVSHAAVLSVNQLPHAKLRELGWELTIAVPARWRDEYSSRGFSYEVLPELRGRVVGCRVLNAGSVQRHVYVTRLSSVIRRARPNVVFIEEEPTSIPGLQWGMACRAAQVPFGLQIAENLDRPYPRVAKVIRSRNLRRAAFLAARSPTAASLARSWGFKGPAPVVPHGVPAWTESARSDIDRPFTVGFAGRFVEEKGVWDLVEAVRGLSDVRLSLVGDGPLADELRAVKMPNGSLDLVTNVTHDEMANVYPTFDVLVLPSRTMPTWAEQFGRVLVEAMWCGVPVVGSDSGEIPWVIETTGGGLVFPEGDVGELRRHLALLRDDPALRRRLATAGRAAVAERFSVGASARALDAAMQSVVGAKIG